MPGLSNLTTFWQTVKEIDLEPLRREALSGVRMAVVGAPSSGRKTLVKQLRRDPAHPEMEEIDTPVLVLDLEAADLVPNADLIVLLLDTRQRDFTREAELSRQWADHGKRVLVLINKFDPSAPTYVLKGWIDWSTRRVVDGSVLDVKFLHGKFALAVIDLMPDKLLTLGRYFPLLRVPIARHIINDTCFTNAAYSLSTGLAEIVPVLTIPLTVTDMIVLTKNQAFMAFKLGLTIGFSTQWQDYLAEFGGVLGSGFIWRQVARMLIGLVPLWGILPKVAVAYAGTFVVGNAILQWYLTGRHVSKVQMRQLYARSFGRGQEVARSLIARFHLPRLPRVRGLHLPRLTSRRKQRALPASPAVKACPNCGRTNSIDAAYCQYCGRELGEIKLAPPPPG